MFSFQVTPPYIARNLDIDWDRYLRIYESLSDDQRRVGDLVGVSKGFLIWKRNSLDMETRRSSADMEKFLVHQRFFASLALYDLVQEVPLKTVVERYNINKGHVQSLQQQAATFAGMLVAFCEKMGSDWETLGLTFRKFQPRLTFGVHSDLVDLMRVSYLTTAVARRLFVGGIKTLSDLTARDPNDVENLLFEISKIEGLRTAETTRNYLSSQNISTPTDENSSQTIGKLYVPSLRRFVLVDDLTTLIIQEAQILLEVESSHRFDSFEKEKITEENGISNHVKDNVEDEETKN